MNVKLQITPCIFFYRIFVWFDLRQTTDCSWQSPYQTLVSL